MTSSARSRLRSMLRFIPALLAVTAFTLTGLLPSSATAAAKGAEYLLVADPSASALYVYRGTDGKRTGTLDDLKVSSHAGTIALPDGRVIMIDDAAARVVAVRVGPNGRPQMVDSVAIPGSWTSATWAATDARLRYFAFSAEGEDGTASIYVVDLRTFTIHETTVPTAPDSSGSVAETQVYLAGRPLQLVWTTGGQFRATPLANVLSGRAPIVTSTAPVGTGTHGPVVSRDGDAVFSTTTDGVDGATLTGTTLRAPRTVANSATRNIVQNYRPRLAADERTVWGSAAEDTGLSPAQWADTRNNVNLVDTITFTSKLVRLPDGQASRLALSPRYAAISTVHPDGDALTLVDSDLRSATYARIVGTVALPSSSRGPVAGTPTAGTQPHFVAINGSGTTAYVSNGDDGKVSIVDTATRQVVGSINTPSALTGGGYLTVVHQGAELHDLVAR